MQLIGTVIHGDGYGRTLGYPTANIPLHVPLSGVFAGVVIYQGKQYPAAVFASDRRPILEAHLLDFDGDLYGETLTVEIHEKIREAAVFNDDVTLARAIAEDISAIRTIHLRKA